MWKLLSLLVFLLAGGTAEPSSALSQDGLSLLAFKSAVSSDPSGALADWSKSDADPCRWPGVSCANLTLHSPPRVVGLAVSDKNLTGYIPSELGSLSFLRRLNLHGNLLSGGIPPAIFTAASLRSVFLYDNNLTGAFPAAAACALPRLQNLDVSRNSLSGQIPAAALRGCRRMERLVLARNRFSGEIPAGIWSEMAALQLLDLSSNDLSGEIPPDLGDLRSLAGTLNLSKNRLSGEIPASLGRIPADVGLDLRFNNLSGEIPQQGSLANQGPTAFLGNPLLCGFPLQKLCVEKRPDPPQPPPAGGGVGGAPEAGGRIRPGLIVLISAADAMGVALVGLVLVYAYWRMKDRGSGGDGKLGEDSSAPACGGCWRAVATGSEEGGSEGGGGGEGELVAIDKGFSFELDELLRASAYVLGKGGRGIVYKVVLGNGVPVAVRRLGDGGSGGGGGGQRYKEFAAEAAAVGKVRHPNVVRLRAYYWASDEKLLISDFVANGSLAAALRGRSGQPGLSWVARLKIARGAARGLAHLHDCGGGTRRFVHGNVKPSNILLDADLCACIADFGLAGLAAIAASDAAASAPSMAPPYSGFMGGALPPSTSAKPTDRPNHYRAPESWPAEGRPTQKWDVYSFGVVLLELLTGKQPEFSSPESASTSSEASAAAAADGVVELVRWARKGFDDARPLPELVDPAILADVEAAAARGKAEVLAAFHVALTCTEPDPEARPRMGAVSDGLDRAGR